MITPIVFFYILGWLICMFIAGGFLWIEEKPKPAARWFIAAWVWPFVCVYIVIMYGRGFVVGAFQAAELHEFVIQERDLWQGTDAPPVGKEKR